jgi:ATP-dependent 26S proteasome regulatory subunit
MNDFDWKKQASFKRRSQASTVALIESEDPKRVDELLEFIKSHEFTSKDYFNVDIKRRIMVDPFEGMTEWNPRQGEEGEWTPIRQEEGSIFAAGSITDIGSSMRTVDNIIKSQPSVAIIKNVTNTDLARAISLALQNWATHPKVLAQKSTVFVVTPDATLFDEQTRRFCVLIEPPFSTEEEREAMLNEIAKTFNKKYADIIVTASGGMTLHDLETATMESLYKNRAIELSAITKAKMDLMRKYGFELTYPRFGWEAVGGYETLKQYIRDNVIKIIKDKTARSWGVSSSRGIMLFGPGGTGKSLIAKVMAKELELPFIKVSSADLFAGIVGETERKVKQLQKIAEANAPAIVFIDEIDQIGLRRDMVMSTDSGVGRRAQNMLMDWLGDDERKSIIVGATNLMEQLDPAFIRAGRFDEKLALLPPDSEAREEIIHVHTKVVRKIPLSEEVPRKIADLASHTALWTGAELELLCVASARLARSRNLKAVRWEDFYDAMNEVTVNIEKRQGEIKQFIKTAKEFASNKRLLEQQLQEYLTKEKATDRLKALQEELK